MIKATLILAVISFVSIDGLNIQPRIINGILSNPTDFPFFVYVSNCFSHCSATLISESWVLTAAHCLVRNETLKVHLGINKNGAFLESATIPTTSQHIHPQYRQNILDLPDIGLLKLPRSIVTSSHVQPVNLPTKCNDDLENIDGIAMGIGLSSFNGSFDFLLRHTHIRTMSSADCANRLNSHKRSDSMLCAEPNSGQGIFRGDSGGPLLRRSSTTLIGVAKAVKRNLMESRISLQIFTRVQPYYDWISNITGINLPVC